MVRLLFPLQSTFMKLEAVTAANVYAASTGGSQVSTVTSDSTNGSFSFYVDEGDYLSTQKFKVTVSKTDYTSFTWDNIVILPGGVGEVFKSYSHVTGSTGDSLFSWLLYC